ncbi:hypothetical protein D3C84_712860 [compost metagenome]
MCGGQGLLRGGVISVLVDPNLVVVNLFASEKGCTLPVFAKRVGGDDALEGLVGDPADLDVG